MRDNPIQLPASASNSEDEDDNEDEDVCEKQRDNLRGASMLNIPNALSGFRLIGSLVLIGLAIAQSRAPFGWLLGALLISDWIDGKLAIALRQQTTFGARLDSLADASMYSAMLFGMIWLHGDLVRREWLWIVPAVASFAVTTSAGLIKYGRIPSYHTRAAKTSWLVVSLAALCLFLDGPVWPLRLTAVCVILTNVEATAITCVLPDWHADVPSLWHAWRLRSTSDRP
jgi:CDP-diacylglycerol--glycerol-3-phosphate 3-phosphatidyltransferase